MTRSRRLRRRNRQVILIAGLMTGASALVLWEILDMFLEHRNLNEAECIAIVFGSIFAAGFIWARLHFGVRG